MDITEKYVVYGLNNLIGNEQYKTLSKAKFKGWRPNAFDTEKEAIEAMFEDEMYYEEFVILKQIYIR